MLQLSEGAGWGSFSSFSHSVWVFAETVSQELLDP